MTENLTETKIKQDYVQMPESPQKTKRKRLDYKWIALSNTTLGILLASINSNIILISLPAVFKGMNLNPLASDGTSYMLWMLMGYSMVTAVLLVSFGRISDIFGRVRLYNLGFAVYTVASVLLYFTPGTGKSGMTFMIAFRLLQGVGAGFLFSNSTAIITDAFRDHERGFAMGLNQIASIGGSLIGLILGGILSAIDWRLIFLVSVPVGLLGTVWAYLKLKEQSKSDSKQKIDWVGNTVFALGLTILLIAATYAIMPYKNDVMGFRNPLVIWGFIMGIVLLTAFVFIEFKIEARMFNMDLFKIRAFSCGNATQFLSSIAQGGLQFMLIIWLQGIWLPLHGYAFEDTPLWAGIYMLPMMGGFFIAGPLCGRLSDKIGARFLTTAGMCLLAAGFLLLDTLPANFSYGVFFWMLLLTGIGLGMFAAPNTSAVMSSVPAEMRGVSSGMRATFQNTGNCISMALYFAILIYGMSKSLPSALLEGLKNVGIGPELAQKISTLPPSGALFAAFLGYNPMATLLGSDTLASLAPSVKDLILSEKFFPNIISPAVMSSLDICFMISATITIFAAIVSALRGKDRVRGRARAAIK